MDQRNLLLAIVLSVGILIGFQFLAVKLHLVTPPAPVPAGSPQTGPATPQSQAKAPEGAVPGAAPGVSPGVAGAGAAPAVETRAAAIADQPRVRIITPRLHGSIALKGARIDDLSLATYHETTDPKSPEVVLLFPTGTKDPYFAQFGWTADTAGTKVPGPDTLWTASSNGPLTAERTRDADLGQRRGPRVHAHDLGRHELHVHDERRGDEQRLAPVRLRPYGLISRSGTPPVSGYYHPSRRADRLLGGEALAGASNTTPSQAGRRISRANSPRPAAGSALPTNTG